MTVTKTFPVQSQHRACCTDPAFPMDAVWVHRDRWHQVWDLTQLPWHKLGWGCGVTALQRLHMPCWHPGHSRRGVCVQRRVNQKCLVRSVLSPRWTKVWTLRRNEGFSLCFQGHKEAVCASIVPPANSTASDKTTFPWVNCEIRPAQGPAHTSAFGWVPLRYTTLTFV